MAISPVFGFGSGVTRGKLITGTPLGPYGMFACGLFLGYSGRILKALITGFRRSHRDVREVHLRYPSLVSLTGSG